jgi:hypothetical protein
MNSQDGSGHEKGMHASAIDDLMCACLMAFSAMQLATGIHMG